MVLKQFVINKYKSRLKLKENLEAKKSSTEMAPFLFCNVCTFTCQFVVINSKNSNKIVRQIKSNWHDLKAK